MKNNNTLGLNSNVISAILTIADNLRKNYQNVGATGYQMPRNPFPMQKLIINVLPTCKGKAMSLSEIIAAIKDGGYHLVKQDAQGYVYVSNTLARLVKSGAVKRKGFKGSYRFWFAL
jgi:hypothetical protein